MGGAEVNLVKADIQTTNYPGSKQCFRGNKINSAVGLGCKK